MSDSRFVILGGGMVAGYAAKQLVELGLKPGELTIVSADTALPYERPPLSKGFLAGRETEESIRISPESFYRDHGIEVRLDCPVTSVTARDGRIKLRDGGQVAFEKLIIATGARARRLTIPGADLANVLYLRSMADSATIRERVRGAKRAVIVGGGFIGMEVSSVIAQMGIEPTMVLPEDRVWKQFFTPGMSRFFETYFEARGVHFAKGVNPASLKGDREVRGVQLADGRVIECDLQVAGIGAIPVIEPLEGSGIETGNGMMVNEYLETKVEGVYAAGDVANYPDLLFGKRRRVEHWDNAVSQGQHCARQLLGERAPFKHVPYFFSDVFDLSYEFWGDGAEADDTIVRGDISTNRFSVWWLQKGIVRAAFAMNRPDEEREAAPKWIEAKQAVSAARLKEAKAIGEAAA